MRFDKPVPVTAIAQLIGADLLGNKNGNATGINEIHKVEKGDIVFVDHPKYYDKCINSAASFIIINKETTVPEGKARVRTIVTATHTRQELDRALEVFTRVGKRMGIPNP